MYRPKYVNDNKNKKYKPPEQPKNVSINSLKLYNYCYNLLKTNRVYKIKEILDTLKILIRSIMKVFCSEEYIINIQLLYDIDSVNIVENIDGLDVTIYFPTDVFDSDKWIVILQSLIPSFDFTNELLTRENFDIFIYIYQNIICSMHTKKRKEINVEFEKDLQKLLKKYNYNKKSREYNFEFKKLKKEKLIKQEQFKDNYIYGFINKINSLMYKIYDKYSFNNEDFYYKNYISTMKLKTFENYNDFNNFNLLWSIVLLRPSSVNYFKNNLYYNEIKPLEKELYIQKLIKLNKKTFTNDEFGFLQLKNNYFKQKYIKELLKYKIYELSSLTDYYVGLNILYDKIITSNYKPHSFSNNAYYNSFGYDKKIEAQKTINTITDKTYLYIFDILRTYNQDIIFDVCMNSCNNMDKWSNYVIKYISENFNKKDICEKMKSKQKNEDYYKILSYYYYNNILDNSALLNLLSMETSSNIITTIISLYENKNINIYKFGTIKSELDLLINKHLNNVKESWLKYKLKDAVESI